MRNIILLALVSCVSGSTPPGGMCDDSCLHGGLNKWNPDSESCECNCLNKWSGPTCENCVGYGGPDCNECADEEEINYPSCEKCRVEVQCSGHATSVSANSKKDKCDCSCKDAWSGEECNTCDSSSCPAHSTGKQTGSLCTCVCENYWSGSNCDVCPDEYESGDCLTCAASYVKEADSCRKCTAARDCSNKATNVGSNSARSKCTCSCSPGYGGDSCEKCADGYVGYPNCQQCSNFDKCNNNAERITSEGNKCICHCKFGFGGTTCGECDEGHINYPACTECTTTKHCSSRATKVTSQGNKCVCTCRNKWSGDKCSTCLAPYGGDDCNSCDEEHIGYPSCTQVCNLAGCGGSSLATRGYANSARTKCTCDCLDDYEGETCNQCKAGLVGSPPNCQNCVLGSSACVQGHASDITSNDARTKCVCVCLDNYEGDDCGKCHVGYIEYPTCTQCTSKKHCSDHAKSVTSNSAQSGCTCTCRNKYEGATCAQCPSKYEGDCDKCALGYVKYPECKECTIAEHCSGHASAVSSNSRRTACSCTCSEGYEGSKCNKCADGYINYPTCTKCDLAAECGDRATDVFSNQARDTCECVCKPQYEGIKCDKCSQSYIGTVPACIECNNADHCYGHADSVSADDARMACKCNCKNYWMEEGNCQTCNSTYGGADCDRCADPKGILPSCNQCNSDEHCNGHASSATPKGDGSGTCVCACRNKWEGDTCKECPAKYDPNQDCNACANGLVGFPDCRECTVEKDCTGHAESVKGDPTGTKCLCQGSWLCPGNIWNETCTCQDPSDQKHCPCGVQGCQFSGSCNNGWSGLNCNYCHSRFYGTDCNQCNDNYIRYPWCRSCMEGGLVAAMQRYGCHADRTSSVISNFDKSDCQCGCKAKYETVDYSSEPCDRCAYGYKNYPGCERCDVSLHCAGNAISVGSDTNRTSCVCHCKDGFESTENGLQGCDCCAPGHYGYPDCEQCTIQKHCSGNAISVMDNGESTYPLSRTGCNCTCYGMWEGEDCSVCPAKYAGDCDQCAPGRIVYPYCFECTDASHCNGHSSSVAPDASQQACVCECKNGWGGSHGTCRSCESPYKGTECNECDNGGSMPDCNQQCTVHSQCSNHAFGVKEVGGECQCDCRHNWEGKDCSVCPPMWGGTDCNECGKGYFRKADGVCGTCTNDGYCNGRACAFANCVRSTATECICEQCTGNWQGVHCDFCPDTFSGPNCDQCADGRTDYPTCKECQMDCRDGRGESMGTAADGSCYCKCKRGYSGRYCESCATNFVEKGNACECPSPFDGPQCNKCKPGFAGYPDCYTCSVDRHCHSRADSVSSDGYSCECECSESWCGMYGTCRAKGGYGYPVVDEPTTDSKATTRTETLTLTLTLTATVSETLAPECAMGYGAAPWKSRTPTPTLIEEEDEEESMWWLWVLISLGVIFLCSMLIYGAVVKRKKKTDELCEVDNSHIMLPLQDLDKDVEQELYGDELPEIAEDETEALRDTYGEGKADEQPEASIGSVGEINDEASMGSAPLDDDYDDRRDV